jgi:hypothetical protein
MGAIDFREPLIIGSVHSLRYLRTGFDRLRTNGNNRFLIYPFALSLSKCEFLKVPFKQISVRAHGALLRQTEMARGKLSFIAAHALILLHCDASKPRQRAPRIDENPNPPPSLPARFMG